MPPEQADLGFLWDMLEAAQSVQAMIGDMVYEQYCRDRKTRPEPVVHRSDYDHCHKADGQPGELAPEQTPSLHMRGAVEHEETETRRREHRDNEGPVNALREPSF